MQGAAKKQSSLEAQQAKLAQEVDSLKASCLYQVCLAAGKRLGAAACTACMRSCCALRRPF